MCATTLLLVFGRIFATQPRIVFTCSTQHKLKLQRINIKAGCDQRNQFFCIESNRAVNPSSDQYLCRLIMLASKKQESVMTPLRPTRRRFIQAVGGAGVLTLLGCERREQTMVTLYTFGDSILDCGRYNEFGVHPGQLLVQNDDRLFPEFQGQDLTSRGPARLEHRARDGATVDGLPSQAQGLRVEGRALALITIGGNDLLRGLIRDTGAGMVTFANALDTFVQ